MTFLSNVKNEFNNSPIIVSCTTGGFFIAIIMLSFALKSPTTVTNLNNVQSSEIFFSVKNLLFCLAYYVFIFLSGASLIRLLSRYYDFTATLLSIPTAVIINFSTYIAINLLPPTLFSKSQLLQISDLIYWSTLVLFVAFCGKAVMKIIIGSPTDNENISSDVNNKSNNHESDIEKSINNNEANAGSILLIFFVCLFIWGKMVSYGQNTLISSILPEAWQPIAEKNIRNS